MSLSTSGDDPIRHVVVLILENHSFDQMLGCFKQIYPTLEGIDPAKPQQLQDHEGRAHSQAPTTERMMLLDPHHEVEHVATQLDNHNGGFVSDYSVVYPDSTPESRGYVTHAIELALKAFAHHSVESGKPARTEPKQHDLEGWYQLALPRTSATSSII